MDNILFLLVLTSIIIPFRSKSKSIPFISSICILMSPQINAFFVGPEPMDWHAAKSYCESRNTRLASIHSADDQEKAKTACQTKAGSEGCWIGLSEVEIEGEYVWSDGTSYDYSGSWAPGEPNNSGELECVHLRPNSDFEWNDRNCYYPNIYPLCNS